MEAMNVAYDEDDDRGFLRQNLVAFGLTLLLVTSGCIALALLVGLPSLTEILGLRASWMQWGLNVVAWVLIAGLAIGTLAAVYRFVPNRDDAQWRWITPGAALALGIWLVASLLFSLYVANFGKYGETYGSLAAVVILLMWLWVSAYVVILGAEVNAEAEHQTREDTTTGPRERMGRRGAHVADTLGEAR